MNQRGFATLEVILMVMVIGILASIAVPRFTSITTAANTAKVQADLSTIDTAIAIYIMEEGEVNVPTTPSGLSDYLQDASNIKPPKGDVYNTEGTDGIITVDDTDYAIAKQDNGEYRATLEGKTAGTFKKSTTN